MSGKRAAIVHDIAARLAQGGTAKVVGGEPLAGREFHVWADDDGLMHMVTKSRHAAPGIRLTMKNQDTVFYTMLGREDAEGILADARRIAETIST